MSTISPPRQAREASAERGSREPQRARRAWHRAPLARYIGGRLLALVQVLFVISVVIFLLIYLMPGDPAVVILGDGATPDQIAALRAELGLDQNLFARYGEWLGQVVRGDLGHSIFLRQDVAEAIAARAVPTVTIALLALLVALAIALPLGMRAAQRPGGPADGALAVVAMGGVAIPGFLLAIFLIQVMGVNLGWLPVAGYAPPSAGAGAFLSHLVLPAVALGAVQAALIGRVTRSTMREALSRPFITTARAGGASRGDVAWRFALPTALPAILTIAAQSLGTLIAGAVVIETIFNVPGLGQLVANSIERRDYLAIQGVVLVVAVFYVLLNLVVDLLYPVLDPRVRLGEGATGGTR
ncbi:MAG TPA: ABC transporter permease [Actinomycetaceae bacterium]|nr:ABC transporter permease [Actinomycetaceae bacterium]